MLGPLAVVSGRLSRATEFTEPVGLGLGVRIDICGSTDLGSRSMYVFMGSVFLSSVVWGVSPTICGSAPFTRRNPRLLRRADTAFTVIASHTG